MKKGSLILLSILTLSFLAGCNLNLQKASGDNQTNTGSVSTTDNKANTGSVSTTDNKANTGSTNTTNNQTNTGIVSTTNNQNTTDKLIVYIDKNCENAQIPQCNPQTWKQQLSPILGTGLEIKYISKDMAEKLKKIVPTTPVMAIPEKALSKFGQQANGIKTQAKNVNGVYYIPLFSWVAGEENLCNDGKDNNGDGKVDAQDPSCFAMTALTSNKCTEQYCNPSIFGQMFMGYSINTVDVNTDEGKKLYDELKKVNQQQYLPTFLFNKQKDYMKEMVQFIKEVNLSGYKYQLNIPQFRYDPSIEACATNCNASPSCKKLLSCNKTDKPNVDLYVMAYCPFGTQAEKGILGAVNALKGKINFKVKFVNYAMHGKKEVDENNLQYCIQKEEPAKYNSYLTCFLDKGNSVDCQKKAKLDMNKINKCIEDVKKQFKTEEDFNNKASWLSGQFPMYRVYDEENKKYGVQGSPTLVINGVKVQPTSRSPQAYLNTICQAFKNPPKECQTQLSNQGYDPMFGWTQNGKAAPAGSCGGK